MQKYFKHKLENLLVISKIVTLHHTKTDKDFSHAEESHDFWEIVYVEKESVICTSNGTHNTLNKGQMIFHKPNERHAIFANGKTSPVIFIASFVCHSPAIRFFENKIVDINKEQLKYIYSIVSEGKKTFNIAYFNPDMKKMTLAQRPTLGGQQLIKNLLELLLIDIMRSMTETAYGNKTFLNENEFENKFVSNVIDYMKENLCQKITIDDICKKISYSKAYVFKQFKLATGQGVMQYYTNLKIEQAKRLIKEGELTVKEISERLCFDTPNYFTKTFKKINGITPTEYKKSI